MPGPWRNTWASIATTADSATGSARGERLIQVDFASPQRLLVQIWVPTSIAFAFTMRLTIGCGGSSFQIEQQVIPVIAGPSAQFEVACNALEVEVIPPVGQSVNGVWANCAPTVPLSLAGEEG